MTNLVLRGNRYYLRKQVNNKLVCVSLHTSDRAEAERKAQELLAPYSLANKADAQRLVLHQLAGTQGELAIAREKVAEKISIADAWQAFRTDPAGPQCDKRQWNLHRARWQRFELFMGCEHPTVATMQEVTWEPHGREFCSIPWRNNDEYNRTIATVKMVFSVLAGRIGNIPNPLGPAKPRRHEPIPRRCLTEDELRRVFAAVADEPDTKVLFGLGLYTGLRLSDCATVRVMDMDQKRQVLTVKPHKTHRFAKVVTVALPDSLFDEMVRLSWQTHIASDNSPNPILPRWAAMTPCQRNEAIMTVFRRCGIVTQEKKDGQRAACVVGFHSLRHTFITMSLQRGVPQSVVQAICGHASTKTQAGYFHAGGDDLKRAAGVLPNLLDVPSEMVKQACELLPHVIDALSPEAIKTAELRRMVIDRAKKADAGTLAAMFDSVPTHPPQPPGHGRVQASPVQSQS